MKEDKQELVRAFTVPYFAQECRAIPYAFRVVLSGLFFSKIIPVAQATRSIFAKNRNQGGQTKKNNNLFSWRFMKKFPADNIEKRVSKIKKEAQIMDKMIWASLTRVAMKIA